LKFFRRQQKVEKAFDLPFFEVEVASNESWTVWNQQHMPLVFPTHMFSRFAQSILPENLYSRFAVARVKGLISGGKHGTPDEDDLLSVLSVLNQRLTEWRDETMDRFVSLPTFCFFGEDAVKAMRLVLMSETRKAGQYEQNWLELPLSFRSKGTLVYGRLWLDDVDRPLAVISHPNLQCLVGDAWQAKAYLSDGIFSIPDKQMVELSKAEANALASRAPIAEFVFMLLGSFLDRFDIKRDAKWEHFTGFWLPKHAGYAGVSLKQPIPRIDSTASPHDLRDQIEQVMHWSYLNGFFCRAYQWLDMQFEGKRG